MILPQDTCLAVLGHHFNYFVFIALIEPRSCKLGCGRELWTPEEEHELLSVANPTLLCVVPL